MNRIAVIFGLVVCTLIVVGLVSPTTAQQQPLPEKCPSAEGVSLAVGVQVERAGVGVKAADTCRFSPAQEWTEVTEFICAEKYLCLFHNGDGIWFMIGGTGQKLGGITANIYYMPAYAEDNKHADVCYLAKAMSSHVAVMSIIWGRRGQDELYYQQSPGWPSCPELPLGPPPQVT